MREVIIKKKIFVDSNGIEVTAANKNVIFDANPIIINKFKKGSVRNFTGPMSAFKTNN